MRNNCAKGTHTRRNSSSRSSSSGCSRAATAQHRIAVCRGKVMYLSLQCLQWHVKLCVQRQRERERGPERKMFVREGVRSCTHTRTHRQLCPCGFYNNNNSSSKGIFRACTSDPNSLRNYDSSRCLPSPLLSSCHVSS